MVIRDHDLIEIARAVHDSVSEELARKVSLQVKDAFNNCLLRLKQLESRLQDLDRRLMVLETRSNQEMVTSEVHLW